MNEQEEDNTQDTDNNSFTSIPMSTSDFLSSLEEQEENDEETLSVPFSDYVLNDIEMWEDEQEEDKEKSQKEKFWFVQMYFIKDSQKKILNIKMNEDEEKDKIELSVDRCFGVNDKGFRCPSFTCLVHPYCMECTKKYYRVRISIQPDNRFSLYCCSPPDPNSTSIDPEPIFREGSKVVPLFGEILTKINLCKRYPLLRAKDIMLQHVIELNNNYFSDTIRYRGPGFYSRRSKKGNVRLRSFGDHAWLVAKKQIYHGEEIILEDNNIVYTMIPETSQTKIHKSESVETTQSNKDKHTNSKPKSSVSIMLHHHQIG